ncbi:dethiobiotin synthase [Stutzerimonas balearica]|uniref:ATP-dependent dethiobiotin synthetase BioD n=1 Tax=Stutzerimonas balearica DSM 6083 TaxID=1123016 RepID=A0A8D4C828_9GAMM|nr:dethiobiotin synthase [Stutzerimonas balearica]AJE16943.1 dethiobiotin synthetase [Stutzerimonas balearica DSM 6083]WIX02486.1 dethiobiotin synthase [Pseudomonas sp. AR5]SDM60939.1 dethiobiotin synthase [Stutzerimonas balearica DSM 6083]
MKAFFVAGTDTDVGKTTIAAGLLCAARLAGLSTAAVKPVASGSWYTVAGLRNDDALALQAQCNPPLDYSAVNPLAFEPAIAPHIAAREAGVELSVATLRPGIERVLARGADFTLVEGAGGWRVPLSGRETLADLAVASQLPVLLVVGVRLGCINHALLTAEAIHRDGLALAGWIANVVDPHTSRLAENLATLGELMPAPCLGTVPWLEDPDASTVAKHVTLAPLGIAISAES